MVIVSTGKIHKKPPEGVASVTSLAMTHAQS